MSRFADIGGFVVFFAACRVREAAKDTLEAVFAEGPPAGVNAQPR